MKYFYLYIIFLFLFKNTISQTISDIDGNTYNTVIIGNQTWMKENLKTSRYLNGDTIKYISNTNQWQNNTGAAYTIYNNDFTNDSIYGKLYTWYAVTDPRGVCPEGWKIPSDEDWTILTDFLGGSNIAGGKMKEAGNNHWQAPNTGADNNSGFTALPAGMRAFNGDFYHLGELTGWWSSTEYDQYYAWMRDVFYDSQVLNRSLGKLVGFSCRCIKDFNSSYTKLNNVPPLIYPNPAKNILYINTNLILSIKISSISGNIELNYSNISKNTIDINYLSNGYYFAIITLKDNSVIIQKLIIIN